MITNFKFEYGDRSIKPTIRHRNQDVFNHNLMIFNPVDKITNGVFDHWENVMDKRDYPYAVYLVECKDKTDRGFKYSYNFTMITKAECIADINNPPDSEGIVITEESEL